MSHIGALAFVDSAVTDAEYLLRNLQPGIAAVALTSTAAPLDQIATVLAGYRDIGAIHIIAHGQPGEVRFGGGALSLESLDRHRDGLARIGAALSADGQIHLWVCDAGRGERGRAFVDGVARMAGVAVSAATGRVGAAALGGSWELDLGAGGGAGPPLTPEGVEGYAGSLASFSATTGIDTFIGGTGADSFTITDTDQIQPGDTFDGDANNDSILIGLNNNAGTSCDLSAAATDGINGFLSVEKVTFRNSSNTSTVTLDAAQFGAGKISTTATFTGTSAITAVIVNMSTAGSFSLSDFTFSTWTSGTDSITVNGSSGVDTIGGKSGRAAVIAAGAGNDTLVYNGTTVTAWDRYDGSADTDTLQIGTDDNGGVSANLSGAASDGVDGFINIEGISFVNTSGTTTATFSAAQFGAGKISATSTVTGNTGTQALVVNLAADGSLDLSGFSFSGWTSGTDTITLNGSTGAETIVGTSQRDTISSGGGGQDSLTGGGGLDTFEFAATDNTLSISGTAGTNGGLLSGYDRIADFAPGMNAAGSELLSYGSPSIGSSATTNDSSLWLHTNATVKSHSISNGIITFDDASTFANAVSLTTDGDVAAATEYLAANDWGNAGKTIAFEATISGTTHTYVYIQTAGAVGIANGAMVDLVNVSATSIVDNGSTLSVVGATAPAAPGSAPTVAENAGGGINANEASDGTPVVVSLTGTGAEAGDTLTINWGARGVDHILLDSDIVADSTVVTVPAAVISTQGDGTFNVTAAITDQVGNASGSSAPVSVTVDRIAPTVAVDIADAVLGDGHASSVVTFTFSEVPAGFAVGDLVVTGGMLSNVATTADPLVYTATFTAEDGFAGTGSVSLLAGSYTDEVLNPGGEGSDTVAIDRANPTVAVDIADGALSDADPSSELTFTFSEAPVGFAADDIVAVGGTVSGLAATADPLVYTATFSAADGFSGTGSVSVAAGSYADGALNAGGAGSDTVAIDRANAGVRVDILDSALSDAKPSSLVTFIFSEVPVGFTSADITAVGGTVSGLSVTAIPQIYLARFTAADGFAGSGSVSVAAGSYTDSALTPGDAGSDVVAIDRANPTVTVDIVDATLSDGDPSSTVTFAFSEATSGFAADDIVAVGGTVSGLAATADPLVYTATFTADDGFAGSGSVSVAAGSYTDPALNAGTAGSDSVTIDRINPTVAVDIVGSTLSDGDSSSMVTFTFSEAPAGFTSSDISVVGGTVSGLAATADPLVYTATFTASDGFAGAGSVSVAAGGYTDATLNPGAAGSDTVAIDRANPTVTVGIADGGLSDSTISSTVTFTFSEAPVGFAADDLVAVGGTVSGLAATADPLVYTATFTAADGFAGGGSVSVAAGSYTDAALNPGSAGSAAVTIDRANPTVAVDIAAGALSDADPSSGVTFAFSEAPAGFTTDDIVAVGGTVSGLAATADPLVYTATFTAADGFAGSGSVSVAAGGYTDEVLNPGGGGSDTVAIDRANTGVTVDIVDGALSDADPSSGVTFTFSEAPVGFAADDIVAVGGTVSGLAATADPLVYTATFTAADGFAGSGSVSVAAGSYTDAALNPGDPASDVVAIDRANPTVTVDIADGALSDADPSSGVTFTFSEAPVGFAADDIVAVGGTVSGLAATADPLVYTATFTAADGFAGSGSVSVAAGSYTDAALNAGAAGADTVALDRANPTVAVDVADDALSDADPSSGVTFTFSEAPAGFAADDIVAVGGTVSGLAATADPLVYTATFTAADGFAGSGSVSVVAGSYADAAFNLGGAGSDGVTIDRANPTVAVDVVDAILSNGSPSSTVTFAFSEAPVGFAADDIVAVGGTVAGLAVTADPLVYTATFTSSNGFAGAGSVSVAAGGYTDVALNAGEAGSDEVTIDRANPTVTVDIAAGALSDSTASSTVTFTFSEAPVGFAADDIVAAGGAVSGLAATADPLVYTATFTASDGFAGSGSVSVAAGGYTDAALNAGEAGSDEVTIDRANPTVTVDIAESALSDGDPSSTVTFTFSEIPAGLTVDDVIVTGGTLSDASATADPLVFTATFTADDGFTGTGSVSLPAGSYADTVLNLGGAGGDEVAIDRVNPTVAVDIADDALSDADPSSVVTFTFSEAPAGFTADDIVAVGGTVSGLAATADPLVYTATFTAADGFAGSGSVSVAAGGYTDEVLNPGGGGSDTVAIDRANTGVAVDIVDGALSDADPSSGVTFTFSEAPAGFAADDIVAVGGTVSGLAATADPLVYTATFTAADGFAGSGSVSVAAGSYTDAALNPGDPASDVVAIDRANPTVTVDIVDSELSDADPSSELTFTFSEAPVGFAADDIVAVGGTVSGLAATADPLVYTATFTAADGFAGSGSVSVAAGSYTDAALNPGDPASDVVAVDRANPTVAVDVADDALSDADPSSVVTFTFSESPAGFAADDIVAVGGTVSGLAATADPLVYTATFTAAAGFAGSGSVSVVAGSYADAAFNLGGAGSDGVTIDRANPTVAVDVVDAILSNGSPSSTVTFAFSEAPVGFAADDIVAAGGTVSGLAATADPLVYTATFTAANGFAGAGSVSVAAGGYTDATLNPGAAGSDTVTIDRANPTVTVDIAAGALSDSTAGSTVTFTFSEAPVGFAADDIVAAGGAVSGLAATADPLVYTATFTASDGFAGSGSVSVAAGGYTDAALNAGEAGSDEVTIDRANPTVTVDIAESALSDGDPSSTVTFTFSEIPAGLTVDDVIVTGGTLSDASATADPLVFTATFTADDGFTGTGSVSLPAGSYADTVLNLGGAGGDEVAIDRVNPTVAVDIADDALSDADPSSVVTFTFSEAPAGFTADDIVAVGGTVSGLAATADPLVYTATFTAADGFAGSGSVSVAAGGYTDEVLNPGGGGSDTVAIDRANTGVAVDIVDGALSDADPSSGVTFTFSEAPAGFAADDIVAVGGTVSGLAATADPLVYTATFTAADGFAGSGSVSVAAGSYTDAALNPGDPASDVVAIDRANPTVTVDIVDSELSDADPSSELTFTFSEAPVGFAADDIVAVGGTVSGLAATADPLVYAATFTADDGFAGIGSVSVAAGGHTDAALNAGAAGADTVVIDRANPTVAVDIGDDTLSDGNSGSAVTFIFNESPAGFAADDIVAVGGTVSGLAATADPLVYTAAFTADDGFAGSGSVSVVAGSYTDAAFNLGGAGSDEVAIDRANPTVAVDIVDAILSNGNPSSTVTFTFSEAPVGFAADDIVAAGGAVSGLAATADPLVFTATFTAADGFAGSGSVSVAAGGYTDAALNAGAAGADTVTIDRTADEGGDLVLSITDTAINAVERTAVAFTTAGIDADVTMATVSFTDSVGHTVTVAASSGTADLSALISGNVETLLTAMDAEGNIASAAGAQIDYDGTNGTNGPDTIVGSTADETFNGLDDDDIVIGDAGDYTLDGGAGNDTLDGGPGDDVLRGGSGDDTYYVDSAADRVIEAVGGGTDTVFARVDYTLAAGQEVEVLRANARGLRLTGNEFDSRIVGGGGDETLEGGAGNDTLNGGTGADEARGGSGDDGYSVDSAADRVIEAVGGGTDTVFASVDYVLAAGQEIEALRANAGATGLRLTGNEFGNTVVGGAGNDALEGDAGNDTLNGGAGEDELRGGSGDDTYYVDSAADRAIEAVGGGTDTVFASVDYALAAGQEIEVLRAHSASGLGLAGNEFDNTIVGGAGDDALDGGAGNDALNGSTGDDALRGGSGDDTYYVDSAADGVIEAVGGGIDTVYASVDYALAAGQEVEVLRANARGLRLTGNEFDNSIVGGGGDETLEGGAGNDTLNGGTGADEARGGSGDDGYSVDSAADRVIEAVGGGTDTVFASVDYVLAAGQEVEALRANAGATGLRLIGNEFGNTVVGGAGNDALEGDAGNDTLNGGAGEDELRGGSGDDTYYVDSAADRVIEAVGGGTDTVFASVDYALAAGQEVEVLRARSASALGLTGNEFDNTIVGSAGDDALDGDAGNDTLNGSTGDDALRGGSGDDTYYVDSAADGVIEAVGGGTDTVFAKVDYALAAGQEVEVLRANAQGQGLRLTGNEFDNSIVGGGGDDMLNGRGGNGSLTGSAGSDTFQFDTTLVAGTVMTISDFSTGTDQIALAQSVFTEAGAVGALAPDAFFVGAAAHDTSDRVIYNATNGDLMYDPDGTGAQVATVFAKLSPGLLMSAGDFGVT